MGGVGTANNYMEGNYKGSRGPPGAIEPNNNTMMIIYALGHVKNMTEEEQPKNIFRWNPLGRKKRGRPKKRWLNGELEGMKEENIAENMWEELRGMESDNMTDLNILIISALC